MSGRASVVVFASLLAGLGCATGSSIPPYFPVPEDAENPIEVRYTGMDGSEVVPLIARICSNVPISTVQVDRGRGYVATRWVDVAEYERTPAARGLPARERPVAFTFQVEEVGGEIGVVAITAWYQPNRPSGLSASLGTKYDERVPTDHPSYQLALELDFRLKRALREAGATVLD